MCTKPCKFFFNMNQGILKSQTDNIEKLPTLRKVDFQETNFYDLRDYVQKSGHPRITRMDKIGELQGLKQEREYMWVYGYLIAHVIAPFLSSLAYCSENDARRGQKMQINTTLALHRTGYG